MTVRFKNELVRNITIKLGYANAKVRSPFFFSVCCASSFCGAYLHHLVLVRSINAKTKHAHAQVATGHIVPTKRTIRLANDPVVATA